MPKSPTIAGWTICLLDESGNEYRPSWCDLRPEGLFLAVDAPPATPALGHAFLLQFGSGELQVEVGATLSWVSSITSHGVAMLLAVDRLRGQLVDAVAARVLLASA